jgi:iron complex transport system ATP-binding protein
VLDEVGNSLDLRAAHQLREMTRTIARSGTAVIVVTHNLSEIIPRSTRDSAARRPRARATARRRGC